MKLIAPVLAAAGFAGAMLAGCASHPPDHGALEHPPEPRSLAAEPVPGPGSAVSAGQVGMGTPVTGGDAANAGSMVRTPMTRMSTEDALAMCNLSRQVQEAKTPQEREALVTRTWPHMSPEERERHVRMMQEHCR
jgi:hypothetical protein